MRVLFPGSTDSGREYLRELEKRIGFGDQRLAYSQSQYCRSLNKPQERMVEYGGCAKALHEGLILILWHLLRKKAHKVGLNIPTSGGLHPEVEVTTKGK